jgi:acetyl esterase/lipase
VSRYSPPESAAERFKALLDKGFTLFIVRHGSSPKYLIPEIVADVRLATRYIKLNAKKWGVDPDRLGAFGGSAGGHLALMLGMASDEGDSTATDEVLRTSNRLKSIVAYYPPTNISSWARGLDAPGTTRFPALNFEQEKAPAYSPLLFVTPDDPPTLLIHGDADDLVPVAESHRMFDALQTNHVKSEKVILPGAGHGFRGADAEKASALMAAWFEQTLLKPQGQPAR